MNFNPGVDGASSGRLTIRSLSKRYQDHQAVSEVNMDIAPGELVVFLGPSGCGKTTILRSVAGLMMPTSGDIAIDGKSILSTPIHKRELGMVFQSYALFPHMTAAQNVAFGLKMRGIKGDEGSRRVAEALDLVHMSSMAHRLPSQMSGGQQQRVALARAIVTKPKVLLLDEPFSALDAKLRESVQVELRGLVKRLGITTILVTHDQAEAMVTADRIAVLNNGRLEQFDTPQTIYDKPGSLFIADFVGRINRLSGRLVRREGRHALLRLDGQQCEIRVTDNDAIQVGSPVEAVVRPEKTDLCYGESSPVTIPTLMGKVKDVIFTGEKVSVQIETPCGCLTASRQNRTDAGLAGLALGSAIGVNWHWQDLAIFPQAETRTVAV
ncbi:MULTISPECIES: ABC transporter ATP-binding protein [unclassified Burkholderia]|uniref:ABC transporter ATP-binding protein n=1 Tax=unclassified Burkholderia TaxID=2613784 RepID=UPI000F58862C|nr:MULTISPECIES: ABC transporter ATP-binding protein [unclassified Burkholderia]RQS26878.1 ABC transporter ATP-binding protein [Burkholderia sp. Bp8995]RQS51764.1 ABC transporter ATP-binding protein [Burkholderia sp. Bp8989]